MPDTDDLDLPGADATLDAILAAAWTLLTHAATRAAEDAHWPVLASVDSREPEHPVPDARVVVLRGVDRDARTLEVHSDVRAHKLAQLHAAPRACVVFHDRRRELQLRAWADASAHVGDAFARRAWDRLGAASRRAYLAPRMPGDALDAPDVNLPDGLRDRLPDGAEAEPGFARLAVIELRVRRLEWLRLGRAGHQRARFDWVDDGAPTAAWIRP